MITVSVVSGLLGVPVYYSAPLLAIIFVIGSVVERRKRQAEVVSMSLRSLAQQIGTFEPFVKIGGGARSMFSLARSLPDNVEKPFEDNVKEEWLSRISASETNVQKRFTNLSKIVRDKQGTDTSQVASYIDDLTGVIDSFKKEVDRFRTLADRYAFNAGMERNFADFVREYNHFIGNYRNFLSKFKSETGVGVDMEIPFAEELRFSRWA